MLNKGYGLQIQVAAQSDVRITDLESCRDSMPAVRTKLTCCSRNRMYGLQMYYLDI